MEYELWRYLTYSLGDTELTMTWSTSLLVSVHRAALHLVCVLSVQLTIGVMMETVHGGAGGGMQYNNDYQTCQRCLTRP